jgi:mRNA interferase MazF
LVLSVSTNDTDRSLVTLIPHTTSVRGSRFEVSIPVKSLKPGAFDAQSLVTVPLPRLIRRIGVLSASQVAEVGAGVRSWLGMNGDA